MGPQRHVLTIFGFHQHFHDGVRQWKGFTSDAETAFVLRVDNAIAGITDEFVKLAHGVEYVLA